MLSAGDTLQLAIDKPAAGGRMIARADGLVVLVSGAIPGERVRATIERVRKGVAYAAAVDIEEPSEDRRVVGGDPLCGGCLYAHIVYPRQLELKALVIADAFGRIGRLQLPAGVQIVPSPEEGYRMRARLHVRGRRIGFFREGTHEICDVRQTRQLLPATSDALDALVAAARSLAVDGIREIELTENISASQRVVYLDVATAPVIDAADGVNALDAARSLERLAATEGLTGLAAPGAVHGDVYVTDTITLDDHPAITLRRHVLAFFQGNRYLINQLAAHVAAQVPARGVMIDLYAGVGLFAMAAAAARGSRVTAVEGDRIAAADLAANAAATNGAVVAVHQSVETYLDSVRGVGLHRTGQQTGQPHRDDPESTIVVDPPRTGLSREALDGICRLAAPRIVYVSCDVATLARDARGIVDSGYILARVDAFDLFPNTPHVETVTVFDRE
jgi:23S rRNA (uracil1939-C5)-methyltransferase